MSTPLTYPTWTVGDWTANVRDDSGVEWYVTNEDGWEDTPELRSDIIEAPFTDGAFSGTPLFTGRQIVLTGVAVAPNRGTAKAAIRRMQTILASDQRRGDLTVTDLDGETLTGLGATLGAATKTEHVSIYAFRWQITLFLADPRRYGPEQTATTGLAAIDPSPVGQGFPHGFPVGFGGTVVAQPGTIVVNNPGTQTSPAIIEFRNAVNPAVIDVTRNRRLGALLTVPQGKVLVVDGYRKAVELDGEWRMANVAAYDLGYRFPELPPGETVLAFQAEPFTPDPATGVLTRNLVTNPASRATSGTLVHRVNLLNNPLGETTTNVNNWSPGQRVAQTLLPGEGMRLTVTDPSSAAWSTYRTYSAPRTTVTAGTTYTLSLDLRNSNAAAILAVGLSFYDAANTNISGSGTSIPVITQPPNTWIRRALTTTAPEGAVSVAVWAGVGTSSARDLNDTIDIRRVLLEASPTTDPYFDGSTPASGDFTYTWEGTAHASPSRQLVGIPVGAFTVAGQTTAWRRTENDGTMTRFRIDTTAAVGINFIDQAAIPAGTGPYTYSMWVRPSRNLSATPRLRPVTGSASVNYPPTITLVAGQWQQIRVTTTPTVTDGVLGLNLISGQGHQPGDFIDIRERMTVPGTYDGPYFDGSTPDAPDRSVIYDWAATPDASASERRTYHDQVPTMTVRYRSAV